MRRLSCLILLRVATATQKSSGVAVMSALGLDADEGYPEFCLVVIFRQGIDLDLGREVQLIDPDSCYHKKSCPQFSAGKWVDRRFCYVYM